MPERGRVIAGTASGIRLGAPPVGTRPLSDRVKESLFAALESSGALNGPFLDLFAGSGAAGIEALSRGAPGATFVERDARAIGVIEANLRRTGLRGTTRRADALRYLAGPPAAEPFSAVLLDPPYDLPLIKPALDLLAGRAETWLMPMATVVAKHFWRDEPPERIGCLMRVRQKRFGETMLSFYTRQE